MTPGEEEVRAVGEAEAVVEDVVLGGRKMLRRWKLPMGKMMIKITWLQGREKRLMLMEGGE